MPVTGRKPKPEGQKRNRMKPVHDWVEVEDVPFDDYPPLPRAPKFYGRWPAGTQRWWKAVASLPHCRLWNEGDWEFAFGAALLHAAMQMGDMRVSAELRQREKVMGTTVDARRDLRIRYIDPIASDEQALVETDPSVTAMDDYRRAIG